MSELNWRNAEECECVGTNTLFNKINEFSQKYKTNIVVSKIPNNVFSQNNKYVLEAWFNFDSQCYILNAYCTEYND